MTASLLLLSAALYSGGAGVQPVERPNVLLICVDDLRPELASFGAGWIESPNIDALAARGRAFHRHYVQAPTCGASRYALLTGTYGPAGNDALFKRAARLRSDPDSVPPSLPAWLRRHGYTAVSVGKVSHHPGGLGGGDWDDPAAPEMPESWDRAVMPVGPWKHPRGAMHGLARGEIRVKAGKMAVQQSAEGPDDIYPDGLIVDEALRQMTELAADDGPFFLAVGLIKPHLPFGAPARYMEPYRGVDPPAIPHPTKPAGRTTWHRSGEFMKYARSGGDPNENPDFAAELKRRYAACVTYADASTGRLLDRLEELGLRENTVVVLWGDHGWHLGEHAIWGKHALFEESLRSPLIVAAPGLPRPGVKTDAIAETVSIYPTLCDLTGVPTPDFLDGVALGPILNDPSAPGRPACSYKPGAATIRTDRRRLIAHKDGYLELYDHRTPAAETRNMAADDPETAARLLAALRERLP